MLFFAKLYNALLLVFNCLDEEQKEQLPCQHGRLWSVAVGVLAYVHPQCYKQNQLIQTEFNHYQATQFDKHTCCQIVMVKCKILTWAEKHVYLFRPSNVLLAMSTRPPVGLATAPKSPLPTPLKKPVAPSALAPAKRKHFNILASKCHSWGTHSLSFADGLFLAKKNHRNYWRWQRNMRN